MSDVAQILGSSANSNSAASNRFVAAPKPPPPLPVGNHPSRAMKMGGIPQNVMNLVVGNKQDPTSAALPPVVPTFPIAVGPREEKGGEDATTSINNNDAPATEATGGHTIKVGNKWIDTQKPARKWVWASFASSARTDGLLLNHWVRHGIDYPDYPYAKFDIHLDPISYTDEEYQTSLEDESWTKSETDQLMELARKFELRWPVIYDRWFDLFHHQSTSSSGDKAVVSRKIEDLQHRYYSVAAILMQHRIAQEAAAEAQALASAIPNPALENPKAAADSLLGETAAARTVAVGDKKHQPLMHNLGTGSTNKVFDLNYERERRAHLELLWHRTKDDEEEETSLRKELRLVETQLRKLKKSGGHILAATDAKTGSNKASGGAGASVATSANSSRDVSRAASPAEAASDVFISNSHAALLDQAFAATAPIPVPGTPYLQSGRLISPAIGGAMGLNKTLLQRMDVVLSELKIPEKPIPTKRVCDMYDSVRKDILTLLTLQKMVMQKEGQLQSKRLKLSKLGGNIQVADEETALGIPKPQASKPPVAAPPQPVSTTPTPGAKGQRAGAKGKTAPASATGGKAKTPAASKVGGKALPAAGVQDPLKKSAADEAQARATDAKTKAAVSPANVVTGKQGPAAGGKQVPGGKQGRKPAAKRKRKAETKSPTNATEGSPAGDTQANATAQQPLTVPESATKVEAGASVGKTAAKKRSRKS